MIWILLAVWFVGGILYAYLDVRFQLKKSSTVQPPPQCLKDWVIMLPPLFVVLFLMVAWDITCALVWCVSFGRIHLDGDR